MPAPTATWRFTPSSPTALVSALPVRFLRQIEDTDQEAGEDDFDADRKNRAAKDPLRRRRNDQGSQPMHRMARDRTAGDHEANTNDQPALDGETPQPSLQRGSANTGSTWCA